MFDKILVANRGEIACRIMRTANKLGVGTVAVFSEADAGALHVQLADEAVYLGGSAPAESYLNMHKVIAAALQTSAQAIHPGYGFLAENAAFCTLCNEHGLTFIGPPPLAIATMGSKSAARRAMLEIGLPLLPGSDDDSSADSLEQAADEIGYPVLLKAVAGGGGKGIRAVHQPEDFPAALEAARREASSSFGDDRMLVEKYLLQPRHVEVQVFCDSRGGSVYLFERDCSVQRRHQKIIEEAPAPGLTESLRNAMGKAATRAAEAVGYTGAGTVEFLLDASGNFYFMEMNTRLQVEHPVTEMITGQDLVAWQLLVASGEPLPCNQTELSIQGHAFEARIYAEDPEKDFLPTAGQVDFLLQPETSDQLRIDTGITVGDHIGIFYDPMVAKLIVWGEDRDRALRRFRRALASYHLGAIRTNTDFLRRLTAHPAFIRAELSTDFIPQHQVDLFPEASLPLAELLPLATLYLILSRKTSSLRCQGDPTSPWNALDNWRTNFQGEQQERLLLAGRKFSIFSRQLADDLFVMRSPDINVKVRGRLENHQLTSVMAGQKHTATVMPAGGRYFLCVGSHTLEFASWEPESGAEPEEEQHSDLTAPMYGTVIDIQVQPGSRVQQGETLLVMEAMKMEHAIKAPALGTVTDVYFKVGDLVSSGTELLGFTADESG